MDEDNLVQKITEAFNPKFEKIDQRFEEVNQRFEKIDQRIGEIDQKFVQVIKRLDKIESTQDEHSEKLDILTVESHENNQLIRGVSDVVKCRYEHSKREIDEIESHLEIPLTPPFGG